tara:strand:- start:357 stop:680 length:324 start_codon:yes stop_codon:yes gene_type:complete
MPINNIRQLSKTAASNTDILSTDISENCAASGINDAIRGVGKIIADFADGTEGITGITIQDTGGSNKYKLVVSGTSLVLSYNGTDILKVESDGHITAKDDVTAFGTI